MPRQAGSARTTRENLVDAAVRLAAQNGVDATSVRTIAREAGVTEAMLYRHFKSKDELWRDVYTRIVEEMVRDKAALLGDSAPIRQRIHEWVRLTYEYYDGNRDAFTYVLLMPSSFAEKLGDIYYKHGRLFKQLLEEGRQRGELRHDIDMTLALSLFSGVLLNVPRSINDGLLDGPAAHYIDAVAESAWQLLKARGTEDD